MKFNKILAVGLFAVFNEIALAGTAIPSPAKVDLTPVFAGMEKDCSSTNVQFNNAMRWLVTSDGAPPKLSAAGLELRRAIANGQIKVKDDGEYWTITAKTLNASYRGMPLISIDRWIGKDNGYNGISLLFVDSPAVVSKVIGKVALAKNGSEKTMPEIATKTGTAHALLICDFSN